MPAFICAGVFVLALFGSAYALVLLSSMYDRAKLQKKKNSSLRHKRKVKYFLDNFNGNLSDWITEHLPDYRIDKVSGGQLFTKQHKKYIRCFFVAENIEGDVFKDEGEYIKQLAEGVLLDLSGIYNVSHLECVILFSKQSWTQQETEFLKGFIGYWDAQSKRDRLVKDISFNYCGVDLNTGQLYFYQTQITDSGYEADLSHMIIKELQPECVEEISRK